MSDTSVQLSSRCTPAHSERGVLAQVKSTATLAGPQRNYHLFAALDTVKPLQSSSDGATLPRECCNAAAHAIRDEPASVPPPPPPDGIESQTSPRWVAGSADNGRLSHRAIRYWLHSQGRDLLRPVKFAHVAGALVSFVKKHAKCRTYHAVDNGWKRPVRLRSSDSELKQWNVLLEVSLPQWIPPSPFRGWSRPHLALRSHLCQ